MRIEVYFYRSSIQLFLACGVLKVQILRKIRILVNATLTPNLKNRGEFTFTSATTWWHRQMETLSALLALCEGNSSVTGKFPSQGNASDAKLWCFLSSTPEQTVKQPIETPVIWDAIALIGIFFMKKCIIVRLLPAKWIWDFRFPTYLFCDRAG